MYGALGQFMPDLRPGQSLLLQLVCSQDDRLLLRTRVKVDTITAILPADTLTIRSCVAFLWARVSLIRSLMTLRSSWLTDARMLSTSTSWPSIYQWVSYAPQGPRAEVSVDQLAKVFRQSREPAKFDHQQPICLARSETMRGQGAMLPQTPEMTHIVSGSSVYRDCWGHEGTSGEAQHGIPHRSTRRG